MRFLIYLLPLLALVAIPGYGQNQNCLNHLNLPSPACPGYQHYPMTLFFRDQYNIEQEVTVHRIRNSAGRIVHVDLDFKLKCLDDCHSNLQQAINSGLWEFRSAYLDDRFYMKRWLPDCGEGNFCHDPRDDDAKHPADISALKDVSDITRQGSKWREILEWLPRIDAGLNIKDRIFTDSHNEQELREQLVAEQKAPSKFIIQQRNNTYLVCAISNTQTGECSPIEGRLNVSDNLGFADFSHNHGRQFNNELDTWLSNWFYFRPQPLTCTQSSRCDYKGNCTITLSCR